MIPFASATTTPASRVLAFITSGKESDDSDILILEYVQRPERNKKRKHKIKIKKKKRKKVSTVSTIWPREMC
jgi:hypothetical protein